MAVTITKFLHILLPLFTTLSATLPTAAASSNQRDLQTAIDDMTSRSFFGFAILLQMLNDTVQQSLQESTLFIPEDEELSDFCISAANDLEVEKLVLSHSVAMAMQFEDLKNLPTGSIVPSGVRKRLIRICNHKRRRFVVNNAEVIVPDICSRSESIRCHGVDAVIEFGDGSDLAGL